MGWPMHIVAAGRYVFYKKGNILIVDCFSHSQIYFR